MQESIAFLVRVQCRRRESSRSLSHLLMSFLLLAVNICVFQVDDDDDDVVYALKQKFSEEFFLQCFDTVGWVI